MKIARVFPRKTNFSPMDEDCYFDLPPFWVNNRYDEIHISVTFTWDIERAYYLKDQWQMVCNNVKIGGPAFGDNGFNFKPGIYLKNGCIFTSKGCPNNCSWCYVPRREGKIKELKIYPGHIICDNNFLACSKQHKRKVYKMLKTQRNIDFNQGLDSRLIDDDFLESIRNLRIKVLRFAYDYDGAERYLIKTYKKVRKYFDRKKLSCYVLIGFHNDTIKKAENRLIRAFEIGFEPFAMLFKNDYGCSQENLIEWKKLQRIWSRPAIYRKIMNKKVLDFRE